MKKLFALCLLVMATLSLSAKTIKEFVVTTQPQMSCQNCENKIKKNLRFEKGVTNIRTDLQNQLVVVTYDADKTNEANITEAFGKLDYKVTPVADATATSGKAPACTKEKGSCPSQKKCDGKAEKKCDAKAEKKCDGSCEHAEKKCDGKAEKKCDAKAEKKCDGSCKHDEKKCDKGDTCCQNKKK